MRFEVIAYPDGYAVIDHESDPRGNIVMYTVVRDKAHREAARYNRDPAAAGTDRYTKGAAV